MRKQPSEGFFKKSVMRNFAEFTRKYLCRDLFFDKVKLCRSATSLNTFFAEHHRTTASYYATVIIDRTTGSYYTTSYCIAVSIVMKEELASGSVNYDTKLKHMYQFEPEV